MALSNFLELLEAFWKLLESFLRPLLHPGRAPNIDLRVQQTFPLRAPKPRCRGGKVEFEKPDPTQLMTTAG